MERKFVEGPKWLPRTISQQRGPVTFEVKLEGGRLWKHHTDQLKHQKQNHSSKLEGHLPSDGEVDYGPIFLFLLRNILLLIMAFQPLLTSITTMDGSQMVSASGDSLLRSEDILYVNDILLINITNSLFVIYIYIYIIFVSVQ